MNSKNKSIVLVDQLLDAKSEMPSVLNMQTCEVVTLDPVRLFSESDWTRFEEDIDVLNKIYSHVFDQVVIANKKLVCFWPLSEQFGSEWIELASLCRASDHQLEVYKSGFFEEDNYGFSGGMLCAWKRFVYFLIESLLEDIGLNQGLEEIATLTSGRDSIVLFKLDQEEGTRYTFALSLGSQEVASDGGLKLAATENSLPEFDSFQEMLVNLADHRDLGPYQARFSDPGLEKVYFNILAKKSGAKNLIEAWIETYSLN